MGGKGGVLKVKLTSVNLGPGDMAAHPGLKPGPHAKLTVEDTGCGIDEAVMEKIFDPYFTTREKGTGTGLGLGRGARPDAGSRGDCHGEKPALERVLYSTSISRSSKAKGPLKHPLRGGDARGQRTHSPGGR